MSYPLPPTTLTNLSLDSCTEEGRLISGNGYPLEISVLQGQIWCLEVRLDAKIPEISQAPFTGRQLELGRLPVRTEELADCINLNIDSQTLCVNRASGSFKLSQNKCILFESAEIPFSHFSDPILLHEGILSPARADLEARFENRDLPPQFATRMVRFQTPRPSGLVLGLPGQAGEMNRNGYRFELYNTDNGGVMIPDRRPLYQSWPILIYPNIADQNGTGWIALFYDNPSRTFVDIGDFFPNLTTFESVTNNPRLYLISGNSLPDVSSKICSLLGVPQPLPLWSLGYQQCRWSYMSAEEISSVAERLRAEKIPCDTLYYDIDYMDGFRVFTHDKKAFPDLAGSVSELKSKKFQAVSIIDPGVKVDPNFSVYQKLLGHSYLKDNGGKPFVGRVWPGDSIFPDFGNPKTSALWSELQADWLTQFGFSGIWNDMNEPANFDGDNRKSSKSYTARGPLEKEWNLYGYYMARASRQGWHKAHDDQPGFIITRSGYPGVQQHSIIWHGDNHCWWEHLRLALDTMVNYSLCGAFVTGADVPGFNGNPTDDLAVRFFQLGAFMPFFRGHSVYFARDKEPYAYSQSANALIRAAIELRYSLSREWLTGLSHSIQTKQSPFLPVLTSDNTLVRDQFTLFEKFLVAPIVERDQRRRLVYLPHGGWYRFGSPNKRLEGGEWIVEDVLLENIPIYVREGSVVVRNTVCDTVQETLEAGERLEKYPDLNGQANGLYYHPKDGAVGGAGSFEIR